MRLQLPRLRRRGCVAPASTDRLLHEQAASMDASMDGMAIHDATGCFVYLNRAHAEIYGYGAAEELLGSSWEICYDGDELRRFREEVMPLLARTGHWRGDAIGRRKDGSHFPQELSLSRIASGGLVCVVRDITKQKEHENALARLAEIVESSEESIVSLDLNGVVQTWNKAAEKVHGYTAEEMVGRLLTAVTIPEYAPVLRKQLGIVAGGKSVVFESRRRRKDGELIDVAVRLSPLRDATGAIVGTSTIARDISARKQAEAARERETRRVRIMADGAHHLLSSHSPEQIVREIFDNIAAELGLDLYMNFMIDPPGDVLRLDSFAGISPQDAQQLRRVRFGEQVSGVVAQQRRESVVFRVQEHDEASVAILRQCNLQAYAAFPLIVGDKLIGTLSFGSHTRAEYSPQDVDFMRTICDFVALAQERALYQRHLEQRVQERTARLRETIGELEAFSYSVSHDMRAPLRAIRSFAHILLEDYAAKLNSEGSDYLQKISSAAQKMDELIQDVLSYTRVIRAQIKIEPVDTDRLVRQVIEMYPQLQSDSGAIRIEGPLPKVYGNIASLTQCVSNLLGNAVKFVAPGVKPRVVVRAETRGRKVRLWFEDNGIGIDPKLFDRIFGIFERGAETGRYEGTGIGLAIVKKAVERMGGSVGVESELGKGSRFWIELEQV